MPTTSGAVDDKCHRHHTGARTAEGEAPVKTA